MGFGIFDGQMGYRDLDVLVALKAGTTDTAEVLKSSHNALCTVDVVHLMVHAGRYFSAGVYNAALAGAGTLDILVQTGTQAMHLVWRGSSSGHATLNAYEGTTFSAAGTALAALNHNRTSAKTTDATITHTPTVTAVGTQMNGTEFLAAGNKGDGAGAIGSAFGNEFNLAPSTSYLFRLTNVSGGASQTSTGISFYHPLL